MVEVAIAVVILSIGTLAAFELIMTCNQQTDNGLRMTTAIMLANNIQELTAKLPLYDPVQGSRYFGDEGAVTAESLTGVKPFNDLGDLAGKSFNPPIDAARKPHPELSKYTQQLVVEPVNMLNLKTPIAFGSSPYKFDTVRLTLRILYSSGATASEVNRISWVRTAD